jgi:adenylosuccinate synthase
VEGVLGLRDGGGGSWLQGALLDVWHGTYPFVTSSSTVAANAAVGSGLGPQAIGRVLGVTKAYATRVGSGPFPTELHDAVGARIREVGREFGATTGRPRRCGWLDLPALRYAARINGLTSLALMKLDVLQGFHPLKVCTAYTWRGRTYEEMPTEPAAWAELVPVYAELPGFDADLRAARSPDDLPATARDYVERISAWMGLPIELVSVGPGRDENVVR